MRNAEHLTIEQLRDYAADMVENPARREIGAHLINCPDCRARLPKPSTEQFLAALFTENTISENDEFALTAQAHSQRPKKRSIFGVGELLFPAKNLVWGTGAFVLLTSFLLVGWWLTATKNSGGKETANSANSQLPVKVAENKNIAPAQTPLVAQTDDDDQNAPQPTNKNSVAKTAEDSAVESRRQPSGETKVSERPNLIARQSRETETEPKSATEMEIAALLEKTPPSVASLRSNGTAVLRSSSGQQQPTANKLVFALTFPVGETVLDAQPEFRWQAIPTAKSYQISILDSSYDEIASATVTEPVFKLDKPLVRGEIYLWRVAAKTDAGEVIVPQPPQPPARFRVADEKTEKQIAESQKRAAGKLARAALLAREGMLDSAAQLLREILRENPRHKSARRLLDRVEEWQRTAR